MCGDYMHVVQLFLGYHTGMQVVYVCVLFIYAAVCLWIDL
jgi:hypothetical protein